MLEYIPAALDLGISFRNPFFRENKSHATYKPAPGPHSSSSYLVEAVRLGVSDDAVDHPADAGHVAPHRHGEPQPLVPRHRQQLHGTNNRAEAWFACCRRRRRRCPHNDMPFQIGDPFRPFISSGEDAHNYPLLQHVRRSALLRKIEKYFEVYHSSSVDESR